MSCAVFVNRSCLQYCSYCCCCCCSRPQAVNTCTHTHMHTHIRISKRLLPKVFSWLRNVCYDFCMWGANMATGSCSLARSLARSFVRNLFLVYSLSLSDCLCLFLNLSVYFAYRNLQVSFDLSLSLN